MEDPLEVLNPGNIYKANALLLWKHPVHGSESGLNSPLTCCPNPVVQDDLVVASIWSPGLVYAVDKTTGERRWRHQLGHLGATPITAEGSLFVSTSHSLRSLSPQSGKSRWRMTPPDDEEYIYSLPVYANGSVYIGTSEGWFYSLSAETGKELWAVKPSRSWNASVNATALAFEDLIITACNARLAVAYDQLTGQEVWRQRLPDGSIYQVQWYDGMVLVRTRKGLYGLSPRTGEILQKWRWRGQKIESVAVAGSTLCVVVSNEPGRDEKMPPNPRTELLGIQRDGIHWRLPYPRKLGIDLRWDCESRLLYEATYYGLGIVDPETGTRHTLVTGFSTDVRWDTGKPDDEIGLPSIENGILYILHTSGMLWALHHPVISSSACL
ncbi:MAG: Protein kinase [Chthonomonadaceae bacterium]|nr:Protein kinase [Chthonomonadaceae bacterium]